jgi:alpha-L-rhamnosidase
MLNKKKTKWLTFSILLTIINQVFAGVTLDNLKVDYETTPLGIDITNPHFSWQMKANDNKRGYAQTAYQIVVTDANNQVVWDTQKVNSDISHGIEYSGIALKHNRGVPSYPLTGVPSSILLYST